ncbi:MAG: hypothetical protein WDN75_16885 [Bacteroidota bacterium]
MTLDELKNSLSRTNPPENLPPLLRALWFDAKGDWNAAHNLAQEVETSEGSWVHAYLHRKEGDDSNASYWYRKARKDLPAISFEREWEEIATVLLTQ